MPPLRLGTLAREPTFTKIASVPATVQKDAGGMSVGSQGLFAGIGFIPSDTGMPVTPFTAQGVATVYACEKRLADDIGKLPWQIRRRLRRGGYRVDLEHPLNKLFRRPNRWQTPSQCWSFFTSALALRGNAYAAIVRDQRTGAPKEIVPVSPDRVSMHVHASGDIFYRMNMPVYGQMVLHQDNVLHVKGKSFDGFSGISPLQACPDAVALAMAAQTHGAVLFRQGAQVKGVVIHPGHLGKEGKENVSKSIEENFGGVQNAHKVMVFEEGMKFESIQMTNEDAQFLESRKFSNVEICRLFGVPPHKVFDLDNAHYDNLESSEQQYINDTLFPIGNQTAEVMEDKLLYEDERDDYSISLDFDRLLRADRATRYATDTVGIQNGFLSINEARIADGREPIPGGDEYRVALNTAAIDPASPPPAAPAIGPPSKDPA